jgi:hypothetical protein
MAEMILLHSVLLRTRVLALQAIPLVKPAHKLQSPLLRSGLEIDPLPIERFDFAEIGNLLARKTHEFELPAPHPPGRVFCLGGEMLAEFPTHPLLLSEPCAGRSTYSARITLRWSSLTVYEKYVSHLPYKMTCIAVR